jgi:FkbM family methyltransferase
MIGGLKDRARVAIGRYRRSAPVRGLHSLASFVESAYSNDGFCLESNGEHFLLRKLRAANFRTAFDAGANFGEWSIEALAVWPNCRVHAFEVAPQTFQRLSERVHASGFEDRAALNCLGVSDQTGVQQMYYFPDHPELTCDLPRHDKYESIQFDAQLVTLDEYCESHKIDSVDYLKIDVEGAEYRVLKGFSKYINARKVDCIQFEYGAFSARTRFLLSDYYAVLSEAYWIGKLYPTYVDFREYDWTMEDFRFCNYCCVSKLRPNLRALLSA